MEGSANLVPVDWDDGERLPVGWRRATVCRRKSVYDENSWKTKRAAKSEKGVT